MVDLSVLSTFTPVSLSSTKNSSGDGISFKLELDRLLTSGSQDADKLAQKIQAEAAKLPDKVKQLELVERSIAYIRAEGGSDLSLKVYENLKDEDKTNGFLDVFGTADKVPDIVNNSTGAQVAWDKIASGAAYDHIKENEESIIEDLVSAREHLEEDGSWILKVANNPALQNLKVQLMESMSPEEADRDITRMLRQAKDSKGKSLLKSGETVEIELGRPSNTLSASRTRQLEKYRDSLTEERINRAGTPEAAKRILEEKGVIDGFEALRPKGIKPEVFYTEQMQAVLDRSEYNGYTVAAIPSLEKIKATVGGKEQELITTSNKNVFINSDRQFVVKKNGEYSIIKPKDGEIQVGEAKIAIKDIKPSQPKIRILMDENKNQNKVEDESITATIQYLQDQKSVYGARNDEEAKEAKGTLDREIDLLNESKVALAERRKKEEKEGKKSDNNDTLASIMGIIGGIATIVAALSQGGRRNTTITGGGGYNGQGGQNGYGYGSYLASDKNGYNRGYQATVDAAYERSNQYLSTFYNNPVKTRVTIMRQNGMAAIEGRNGGPGVYGYINATRY